MGPRIISGSARGQKLDVPEKGTRPMTDRVKSALFSIIQQNIIGASVLDLYAGTGALGIESLSRGAKYCIFIDKSKEAVDIIERNLHKTGFSSLADVNKASVKRFLEEYGDFNLEVDLFDIVFFTPPYKKFKLDLLDKTANLLKDNGILVAEHAKKTNIEKEFQELEKIETRSYGITSLSFFRRKHICD